MKFLKAKAMMLSAVLASGSLAFGAAYGVEDSLDREIVERSIVEETGNNEKATDWSPPEIDSSSWAEGEIYDARVYGLITYDLSRSVTENLSRADAAEVGVRLYERLTGEKTGGELEDPFSDTDDRNVLKAYKLGIVRGTGGSTFEPDLSVTREDLAVIMYNAIGQANPVLSRGDEISAYKDAGDVSDYAEMPMEYMLSNGIIRGKTETMLYPKHNTTKEEALIVAKRIYERMNDLYGKSAKGLFYRVSNGEKDLYILGSVHMATDNAYPMSKKIRDIFKESSGIAVEVNILEESQLTSYIMSKAMYPEGQSLKDDISPELYEEVSEFLSEHGVLSISDLEGYRPWYINMVLPLLIGLEDLEDSGWGENIDYDNMTPEEIEEIENLPYQYTPGIDKYFLEKSTHYDMEISELEGAEYQINMLSDMSKATQEELLRTTVSQLVEGESDQETLDTMISYWRTADHDSFEDIIEGSMESTPEEYNNALWHIRNREMSDVIENYLEDPEAADFVVVGAGHLVGDTSIVKELTDRGYTVEMIK